VRIADRIKRERIMWGMTQEDLAEATGIDRDKIAKIETGRRDVGSGELPVFAGVFELAVDDLLRDQQAVVHHRVDLGRPATQEARAWLEQCIDNSLFVRQVEQLRAQ
jgi:transcriptional regulator with XRE-family HTH domain